MAQIVGRQLAFLAVPSWTGNKMVPYPHRTPCSDVLGRVFSALDPEVFNRCFVSWVDSIAQLTSGEVIAVDGKTICRSADKTAGKSAFHVVSAFACANGLWLGQVAVDSKNNEITAIPQLLELLSLKGCVVTLNAMGCQKNIAHAIRDKQADYVLMVKGNQKGLIEQIEKVFSIAAIKDEYQSRDLGHGRIEFRKCEVVDQLRFLDDRDDWQDLTQLENSVPINQVKSIISIYFLETKCV